MNNAQYLYNKLMSEFNNSIGVCSLIGQLYYESALEPTNLQNSGNRKLNVSDAEYTMAVDNGSYGNFVFDAHGYGLAQWTFWARKKNLLDYAKMRGLSIGSLELQADFLILELRGYKTSYNAIKNARDMFECSCILTRDFEKPADQSDEACRRRSNCGLKYYQELADKTHAGYNVYDEVKKNDNFIEYTVKQGDTLWGIAKKYYGNGAKYPTIQADNNLRTSLIVPNQKLKIRR